MSNNLQVSNKNINRNVIKHSARSISYKDGKKYYNFDSVKLIKKRISISEKSINILKNIIFYVVGGLTVILFYGQPHNANDILHILNTIKENILGAIYFITPYARCDNEDKWLYLVNSGLTISIIATFMFFILNNDFSFIKKRKNIRFFVSIIFFFCTWYVFYGASFCIIKISKFFKFISIIILLIMAFFLFISVMCIFDVFDRNLKDKEC